MKLDVYQELLQITFENDAQSEIEVEQESPRNEVNSSISKKLNELIMSFPQTMKYMESKKYTSIDGAGFVLSFNSIPKEISIVYDLGMFDVDWNNEDVRFSVYFDLNMNIKRVAMSEMFGKKYIFKIELF
jgi:hypothetical protein